MRVAVLGLSLCLFAPSLRADAQDPRPLPDPKPFLAEVFKHLETDEERQSGYMYLETRRELKLDKNGRATRETVKVFESYPGLPGEEERWQRLVSEDGKPVSASDLEKRDRDRQKKAQDYVRRLETQGEKLRREQARAREKDRKETLETIDELVRVYDMRMLGRERLGGHDTIAFMLTPRPNAKPRTRDGKIMKNFTARVWVSESDYELVRVDIEAIDTVSFGFGLLARVHKGSRASFTRRKVNNEVWLPASASYTASARLGLVKVMRVGGGSEYSGYRKFTVGTSTTYTTK